MKKQKDARGLIRACPDGLLCKCADCLTAGGPPQVVQPIEAQPDAMDVNYERHRARGWED